MRNAIAIADSGRGAEVRWRPIGVWLHQSLIATFHLSEPDIDDPPFGPARLIYSSRLALPVYRGLALEPWRDGARQQFVLAEQAGVFERLYVGQIAQRVETEMRQQLLRRDIAAWRAGLRAAGARGDEPQSAQMADRVAADFLAVSPTWKNVRVHHSCREFPI